MVDLVREFTALKLQSVKNGSVCPAIQAEYKACCIVFWHAAMAYSRCTKIIYYYANKAAHQHKNTEKCKKKHALKNSKK